MISRSSHLIAIFFMSFWLWWSLKVQFMIIRWLKGQFYSWIILKLWFYPCGLLNCKIGSLQQYWRSYRWEAWQWLLMKQIGFYLWVHIPLLVRCLKCRIFWQIIYIIMPIPNLDFFFPISSSVCVWLVRNDEKIKFLLGKNWRNKSVNW